jgi:aspartate/methionine/tyrosine aminotransferase
VFDRRRARSAYMDWAKMCSDAKFNLASSGMESFPMAGLAPDFSQMEINGPTLYGYEPLKQKIAERYHVAKENVVLAAGTSMANYLAMAACAAPGDEVLIEEPGYALLADTARYLGMEVKTFSRRFENKYQPELDELRKKVTSKTSLIVVCNLHNPSSALLPQDTLRVIGKIAAEAGARVIVDEVYLELLWEKRPESAFHLDPKVFVVTSSLTKAYGLSGIRCGWVLADPELVERMWHINNLHYATPAFPAEWLGVIAFEKLGEVTYVQKQRLETNRAMLRECLQGQDALEYVWPEAGTVVFPRVRKASVDEFCQRLRECGVSVVPGRFFDSPEHVRIGVGGQTEMVREGLARLRASITG